jgi:predicted MPP superfamily phosphohydrolase
VFWSFVIVSALLVYVYPLVALLDWLGIYAFDYASALLIWVLVTVAVWSSFRWPRPTLRTIMVNWMGVGLIFFCLCAAFQFTGLFVKIDPETGAYWILGIGTVLTGLAIANALRVTSKHLHFESSKITRAYRIAQISDVHVGSRGKKFLRQMVEKINDLNPETLVITGDLLDSSDVDHEALSPLKSINSPMVFVVGNHERYSGLEYSLSLLQELGIEVLRDTSLLLDEIQFIGIDDSEHPEQVANTLPSIAMDNTKYRILLYHRPLGWEAAQESGIELMLSGHTHNGQIFPFNLLVKAQFKKIAGLYKNGGNALYVSPGTGTWGPIMRLGSVNEITCITLRPMQ